MKIKEILPLFESFKDAKRLFANETDRETVESYIETFRDLAKRNIARGQEKDISYWIRQGWQPFKGFVDSKKNEWTGKDIKKRRAVTNNDQIVIENTDQRTIVIPLTKNAACKWGKHTDWCVSALSDDNAFFDYLVYQKSASIMILLDDSNGEEHRYTALYDMANNKFTELHGSEQRSSNLPESEFLAAVNQYGEDISMRSMANWIAEHRNVIARARKNLIQEVKKKVEERKDADAASDIMRFTGYDHEWFKGIIKSPGAHDEAKHILYLYRTNVINDEQVLDLFKSIEFKIEVALLHGRHHFEYVKDIYKSLSPRYSNKLSQPLSDKLKNWFHSLLYKNRNDIHPDYFDQKWFPSYRETGITDAR